MLSSSLRASARRMPRVVRAMSSDVHFDASSSDVVELIESNLDKSYRKKDENPLRLLTTRREAIHLYREIYRVTSLFTWPDPNGVPWRDVLRASARQEFESARFENDPEIINRLLVVGRDAMYQIAEKFAAKHQEILQTPPPGSPDAPCR